MNLENMAMWAKKKGIDLIATADWTHPLWFHEIKNSLQESSPGIFSLKSQSSPNFLLSTEVASIYQQGGKLHRIHNLIFSPSFAVCEKIIAELRKRGANLNSDGRPMLGISAQEIVKIVLGVEEKCLVIPAHVWTPWFSLYGSMSGFDSVAECFGDQEKYIYAIETGLSSNPEMNWRIKDLDNRQILSFSDAHSGPKLGREATVFELPELSYENIRAAIMNSPNSPNTHSISHTLEFYPEEGKYHYTGHRSCGVIQSPEETRARGTTCHVCGKPLTVGVMHRVEQLTTNNIQQTTIFDEYGTKWIKHPLEKRPPYAMLVPLQEIIAEAVGTAPISQKVQVIYEQLVALLNGEFNVLLKAKLTDIAKISNEKIAEGIKKVRCGNIFIRPGFDGEFGIVKIWSGPSSIFSTSSTPPEPPQMTLF